MKIGIMTFHRALNYGALLQAFALKTKLRELGCKAEVVDYRNPTIEKIYNCPSLRQCKGLRAVLKYLLYNRADSKKRKAFDDFRTGFLSLSENYYTPETIKNSEDIYDKWIVGSDQVWNSNAHSFDSNFFLHFLKDKSKKYSYAASFGISEIPKEQEDDYKRFLSDYSSYSVREKKGAEILKLLNIQNARVDVDPSMLLKSEEWKAHLPLKKLTKNKYIFAYYFELTPTIKSFIEKLAKKENLHVLYLGSTLKKPFDCKCISIKSAGPIEFVSAINNAEYVVTNSFHGTAFSSVFNKTFFVELLKIGKAVNSRLTNILEMLNLEERQIDTFSSVEEAIERRIDWADTNAKITAMSEDSQKYLKEILDATNN